jgi:hypothetical protein
MGRHPSGTYLGLKDPRFLLAHSADERRGLFRRIMWERAGGVCALCGKHVKFDRFMHLDHRVPREAGGSDHYLNLQATHAACNIRKGGAFRPPELTIEMPNEGYYLKLCLCGCPVSDHYSHWPLQCCRALDCRCKGLRARPNDPELERIVTAARVWRELLR